MRLCQEGSQIRIESSEEVPVCAPSCQQGQWRYRIKESLITKIAAYVFGMLQGKRDSKAQKLLLDTLDDVKHNLILTRLSIFQSCNRLSQAKHTYLAWCAKLLHEANITIADPELHECQGCNTSFHLPVGEAKSSRPVAFLEMNNSMTKMASCRTRKQSNCMD